MIVSAIDRCFLLTSPGVSALATVRIAGPRTAAFLRRRFSKRVVAGRPIHGELCDDAGVIDDPVVVLREDGFAADLTLHGGAWIARCVIALAKAEGFQPSPVDAETIGSTDATTIFEHELLVSLPLARTQLAAAILLAQRAAWVAFVDSSPTGEMMTRIAADRSLEYLLHPPTLAIVGVPNAGKSTLTNQLFGQKRSIVSPIAGTTRDWIGEEANLDGLIVKLIDTPGRRETSDAIEAAAIAASDVTIARADAVVVLLDATRDDEAQRELLESFRDAIVVLNKSAERHANWTATRIDRLNAIQMNALSGDGIAAFNRRVHDSFQIAASITPRLWTKRQRSLLAARRPHEILGEPSST